MNACASIERQAYLDAMALTAASVTIVTTDGLAGRQGMTVSAMTSVSADPPRLLVCIHRDAPTHSAILANGCFAVSVLHCAHIEISNTFAGFGAEDRFSVGQWCSADSGAPLLDDALAAFDCRFVQHIESGSHGIFIGDVIALSGQGGEEALIYSQREYARLIGI